MAKPLAQHQTALLGTLWLLIPASQPDGHPSSPGAGRQPFQPRVGQSLQQGLYTELKLPLLVLLLGLGPPSLLTAQGQS